MRKNDRIELQELLRLIDSPFRIQEFLDSIPYNTTERTLSPLLVMKERMAHCMDGGLFAAAALRNLGFPPLIIDLTAENDDDHIIAVFREGELLGSHRQIKYYCPAVPRTGVQVTS